MSEQEGSPSGYKMNRVGVVVLAAGQSRRFGAAAKLLASLHGRPLITHAMSALDLAELGPTQVIVVIGAEMGRVALALDEMNLRRPFAVLENQQAHRGIASSIACGVGALDHDVIGALIMPADMPFMTSTLLSALIATFRQDGADRPVHAALMDGTPTSPMVWPRRLFGALRALEGDAGARGLLALHGGIAVVADADHLLTDIDTVGALANAERHWRK
jgi:molybdenum cofactor cytidylyltransferase